MSRMKEICSGPVVVLPESSATLARGVYAASTSFRPIGCEAASTPRSAGAARLTQRLNLSRRSLMIQDFSCWKAKCGWDSLLVEAV